MYLFFLHCLLGLLGAVKRKAWSLLDGNQIYKTKQYGKCSNTVPHETDNKSNNQMIKFGENSLFFTTKYRYMELFEQLLYKHNFDIHTKDGFGKNNLYYCQEMGNYGLFQHLVTLGKDINQTTKND